MLIKGSIDSTHAVTKITCLCDWAKSSDLTINAFVFLLILGVECVTVPLKGFFQFSDSEFGERLYYLHEVSSIFWTVQLKALYKYLTHRRRYSGETTRPCMPSVTSRVDQLPCSYCIFVSILSSSLRRSQS